jgi:hypothetical protein
MLSRISKDENNNVKHHFELAAGVPEEPRDRRRKSSTPSVTFSRKSSTHTESITGDDDGKEIEDLFNILIGHNNGIVDLYYKEFYNNWLSLSEGACTALIANFITLETKYNDSKEELLKKKLSSDQQKEINIMDSDISAIRKKVLTHCENTKVEDKDIEDKLDKLDNIIKEGEPIIKKNYGKGFLRMSEANCKEMRDWCDKTLTEFRKKLEDLRDRVTKNGSLPYKKRFKGHEAYLDDLIKKYNYVIDNKCKGIL